jgi:hypothetical protein
MPTSPLIVESAQATAVPARTVKFPAEPSGGSTGPAAHAAWNEAAERRAATDTVAMKPALPRERQILRLKYLLMVR